MNSQQVVLITGASSGFGRLFAETLARRRFKVFATMRGVDGKNSKPAQELRALAEKESLWISPLELDVTDDASVERAVHAALGEAGRIDVLINNAGYGVIGVTEAVTREQASRIMDTNFMGVVRMNRAVLPQMRKQKSGLLMYISSGAGRVVIPGMGLYCASKFAMEALAEAYSFDIAAQGIDSVIIEPGAYPTAVFNNIEMAADSGRNDTYGAIAKIGDGILGQLSGSKGNPQDVADAVLKIVETPAGQRQLRYRITSTGGGLGIDEINSLSARVQQEILKAYGLAELTKFKAPAEIGAKASN